MRQYKKIIFDVMFNIIATALPLVVLQLGILPLLATKVSEEQYGMVLTIVSIITVISGALGNALNNIRLIRNNEYQAKGQEGDFQILLIAECLLSLAVVAVALSQFELEIIEKGCIYIIVILWTIREYFSVVFRLELNFARVAINNLFMVIGYILGFLAYLCTGYWVFIYLLGLLFSIVHLIWKSSIINEKVKITPLFKETIFELAFLVAASLVTSLLNYADRIIIYPLIGGTAVSIYYVSTLFGKLVSVATSPLNSVVLSYISKKDSLKKNIFLYVVIIGVGVATVGYVMCRMIAYPALNLLYPQWANEAMEFVPITTLTAMLTMMTGVLTPFIMKLCKMKWQFITNIVVLGVYIFASVALYKAMGMVGFCIGVLISSLVKLLIMIFLGFRNIIKQGDV